MAKYTLKKISDNKGTDLAYYKISIKVDKDTYDQEIMLPKSKPEEAAQQYADEYETALKSSVPETSDSE
jgi:hypothetical protein